MSRITLAEKPRRYAARDCLHAGRRRESAPQKFSTAHASIHNVLNQEHHLNPSTAFKLEHETALAEWRQLATA